MMMTDRVVIYARYWPVATAVQALLSDETSLTGVAVFSGDALVAGLEGMRQAPVILGLNPHEHVEMLYRLQPLLSGRPVLFVSRQFWWSDRMLPFLLGMTGVSFCSLDELDEVRRRRGGLRSVMSMPESCLPANEAEGTGEVRHGPLPGLLAWMNTRLQRQLKRSLSGREREILLILSAGATHTIPSKTLSLYKVRALSRAGMSRHAVSLFRGVTLRASLQVPFPCPGEAGPADMIKNREEETT
ncbi:hypothetical protein RBC57_003739 [Salmonella enterica]|uniref:Uncharacterized protein n=1 Tax=Salmonella enterica TaxID=28901 RepID=A0A628V6S9_SALER|nr:hypothetical protein [Salmonella enterica]EEC6701473.1 hypothetical protein [Salmonella enterica]ELF5201532.1 hypothetical protein [Salmonella enterica]